MPEEIKFTEEEMGGVKAIQDNYNKIQFELGQLSITKLKLAQQIESLNDIESNLQKDFRKTQSDEKKLLDEITKKYGEGILDPKTGIYKKNK
jgi:uncharacterized protein (DUF3084 family)